MHEIIHYIYNSIPGSIDVSDIKHLLTQYLLASIAIWHAVYFVTIPFQALTNGNVISSALQDPRCLVNRVFSINVIVILAPENAFRIM